MIQEARFLSVGNLDRLRSGFANISAALGGATTNRDAMYASAMREMSAARSTYASGLANLLAQIKAGEVTQAAALERFALTAEEAFKNAYLSGTQRAGNPFYLDQGLTSKDEAQIRAMAFEEAGFWKGFQKDVSNKDYPQGRIVQRMGMYEDALYSQHWNGYVAGLPDDVEVAWVLGDPQTEHCPDCISIAANSPYMKSDLPTVPRAGDTACTTKCYCKLMEMWPKDRRSGAVPANVAITPEEIYGQNSADVYNTSGARVLPEMALVFSLLYTEANRLRQLIELDAVNLKNYLIERKAIIAQIRELSAAYNVRVVPRYTINELVTAVKGVAASGMELQQVAGNVEVGDMLQEVRNIFINTGLVRSVAGNVIELETPTGRLTIDLQQTLVFK